jgi:hypothetical protein
MRGSNSALFSNSYLVSMVTSAFNDANQDLVSSRTYIPSGAGIFGRSTLGSVPGS